jgi:hypothetical protein
MHERGEPQWPKWPSQRCSQTVSWEAKDICQKHINQKAQVCTTHTRLPELSAFQQDQIGHGQMPTSVITFDHVQSWCNPAAANSTNAQPSTRTMAKWPLRAATLTDGFMGNQGCLPTARQSESLSLHSARTIPRAELISAKSNTATVKCQGKVSFSDAWSGLSFQKKIVNHASEHVTRTGTKHECELFELAIARNSDDLVFGTACSLFVCDSDLLRQTASFCCNALEGNASLFFPQVRLSHHKSLRRRR